MLLAQNFNSTYVHLCATVCATEEFAEYSK